MDKHLLLEKTHHLCGKKIARECGLNYYTTRNFLIGRTKFPENNLMEVIDDYCKKVGKELTTPWNYRPDYLRAKMKHLFIQKISDETGFHYMTIRNFVIGFTMNPDPKMLDIIDEYCIKVGTELRRRCN